MLKHRFMLILVATLVKSIGLSLLLETASIVQTSMAQEYVKGGYLYATDQTNGLQILDVTNPAIPQFVASYTPQVLLMGSM